MSEVGVWSPISEVCPKFVWSMSEVWKLPDIYPKSAVQRPFEIFDLTSEVRSMFEGQNPKSKVHNPKSDVGLWSLSEKQKSEVWYLKFVRSPKTVWSMSQVCLLRMYV